MVDTKDNYKFDLRVIGLKGSVKGDSCLFALVLNNTGEIGCTLVRLACQVWNTGNIL